MYSEYNPEELLNRLRKSEEFLFDQHNTVNKSELVRYGFKIGDIGFLISENMLSEVIKNTKIYPLPNTKPWMRGLVNVRGNLVPVFDLSLMLELGKIQNNNINLLVLGKGSESIGLIITGLPQSCEIGNWKKLPQMPREIPGLDEHVNSVYLANDMVWLEFNEKTYFESIKEQVTII